MNKCRVGVMRGGLGSEYYVSLKTGGCVLEALPKDKYEVHDILITNTGEWNFDGMPTTPAKLAQHVDVIFNALHGEFGEDGKVQKILESFGIPYTGSTSIPSAVGMNKELAKRYFRSVGIKVPDGIIVARGDEVSDVVTRVRESLRAPYVVKPLTSGSSIGVTRVEDERGLVSALEKALGFSEKAIVEEYIRGREITVGAVDSSTGSGVYLTPALEILLPENTIFDYDRKYRVAGQPVGPARMTDQERAVLEQIVTLAHNHLGIRHYARYDFILTPEGPYLLEVNTLPGISEASLLAKALELHGLRLSEFLDYVLTLALQKK